MTGDKGGVTALGWIILLGFLGYLACLGIGSVYEMIDEHGLIEHSVQSRITAEPSWIVGETKDCTSYPLASAQGNLDQGYAVGALDCGGGPQHEMEITIYGRLVQPEYKAVMWRCKREAASFDCKQSGGIEQPKASIEQPKVSQDIPAALITSPEPGSTLSGTKVTFRWTQEGRFLTGWR
jgi:hypothetical protein